MKFQIEKQCPYIVKNYRNRNIYSEDRQYCHRRPPPPKKLTKGAFGGQ